MRTLATAILVLFLTAVVQSPPTSPCPSTAEWRQLDFWLGHWEVRDRGKTIAKSHIEKSTNGCIVHEHYSQPDGYSGKSINFYDPTLLRWRQTWVDSGGNVSEFSGEYRDGAMRFEGESHRVGGQKVLRRMTLFNLKEGHVRQFSERSEDSGRSWSIGYDLEYIRAQ